MYFSCPTLKAVMKVSSCEKAREKGSKSNCTHCTKWQEYTTDKNTLRSELEIEAPIAELGFVKESPKFNHKEDMYRVGNIGNRSYNL